MGAIVMTQSMLDTDIRHAGADCMAATMRMSAGHFTRVFWYSIVHPKTLIAFSQHRMTAWPPGCACLQAHAQWENITLFYREEILHPKTASENKDAPMSQ
jgi:hypothetical protein